MKYVRIEGSRKLGSSIEPMKALLTDQGAFDSPDWIFEIKWDGYRAIAEISKQGNRLYSRNGITFDKAFPRVFEALKSITSEAVVDGEIVVFDETGKPNFQKLQNYQSKSKDPIQYYIFDCIYFNGKSITHLPLLERKKILKGLLPASDVIKYCDHIDDDGKAFYRELIKMNLEGVIAKKKKSTYQIGKRSSDWLKIKNVKTQEAIVVGFTDPKGSRNSFGSLLIAVRNKGKLISIGSVGTGFTDKSLKELHAKLKKIIRKSSPLDSSIKETPEITWVDPILVCTVKYTEITDEGSVRHPVFQGLRIDKTPAEVNLETGSKAK